MATVVNYQPKSNFLGGMAGGILQGMQQQRQERRATQRQDWLGQQQARQTERHEMSMHKELAAIIDHEAQQPPGSLSNKILLLRMAASGYGPTEQHAQAYLEKRRQKFQQEQQQTQAMDMLRIPGLETGMQNQLANQAMPGMNQPAGVGAGQQPGQPQLLGQGGAQQQLQPPPTGPVAGPMQQPAPQLPGMPQPSTDQPAPVVRFRPQPQRQQKFFGDKESRQVRNDRLTGIRDSYKATAANAQKKLADKSLTDAEEIKRYKDNVNMGNWASTLEGLVRGNQLESWWLTKMPVNPSQMQKYGGTARQPKMETRWQDVHTRSPRALIQGMKNAVIEMYLSKLTRSKQKQALRFLDTIPEDNVQAALDWLKRGKSLQELISHATTAGMVSQNWK